MSGRTDVAAKRTYSAVGDAQDSGYVTVVTMADADDANFSPRPNTVYLFPDLAANRTLTITSASAALTPLKYEANAGRTSVEGFIFYIQNDDAAQTVAIAGSGNVSVSASHDVTVTAQATLKVFLTRTGASTWVLRSMGEDAHV